MRIRIHRGTKEIGGTCVEIEVRDKRIVLDIGLPLSVDEPEDVPLYPIQGFHAPDPSLLGVVISHPPEFPEDRKRCEKGRKIVENMPAHDTWHRWLDQPSIAAFGKLYKSIE